MNEQKKRKAAAEAARKAAEVPPSRPLWRLWGAGKKVAPAPAPPAGKELAPVLDNSFAWGSFMAISSNPRYQVVNGLEVRVLVRALLLSVRGGCDIYF